MRVEKYLYRKLDPKPFGAPPMPPMQQIDAPTAPAMQSTPLMPQGGTTAPEHFTPFMHPDRVAAELHANALATREAELNARFHAHLQQAVAEAHARGYAEGKEAGLKEGKADGDARVQAAVSAHDLAMHVALEKMNGTLANILHTEQQKQRVTIGDVAKLAMTLARKIAGRALMLKGAESIEAQLRETMASLQGEPQLVVRTAASLAEAVRAKMEQVARESGFRGQLMIEPDGAMQPGDAIIHWSHGTAIRDTNALLDAAQQIVDRYLAAEEVADAAQSATALAGAAPPISGNAGETPNTPPSSGQT